MDTIPIIPLIVLVVVLVYAVKQIPNTFDFFLCGFREHIIPLLIIAGISAFIAVEHMNSKSTIKVHQND